MKLNLEARKSVLYNYDTKMNLISETNEDYVSTTEYDIGNFNIPVCHTVKKDANTTIKTVNILTSDKKDIACQKTYENDVLKKTVHYTYNGEGRISSEKVVKSCACTSDAPSTVSGDGILSDTEYTYVNPTAQNRLLTINKVLSGIKDADNNVAANIVSAAEYDVMGNEVSHTDGNGNTGTSQYDWLGRVIQQQNPDGGVTSINYNISDRTVNVTNPDGTVMKYVYNEWGDIDSSYIINYNANTSPVLLEKVTYDNKCRENGHIKYLDGNTTECVTKTYDGFNRINRVTTVRNNKTISDVYYSYDYSRSDNNRPIFNVTADFAAINGYTPATVQNTYDYRGNLTLQQVKTADKTISTSYKNDFLGNRISKTDSMGNTTSSTYDLAGRKVADTDAKGDVTTYEYDSVGRNIKIISPFDESRTSETKLYYDSNSNITSTSVKNGDNSYSTKDTAYDNMNRPVFVKTYPTAGKTECVQYFYDIMGNVVSKVHGADARLPETANAPENASVTSYA